MSLVSATSLLLTVVCLVGCDKSEPTASSAPPADLASPGVPGEKSAQGALPDDPVDRLLVEGWRGAGVVVAERSGDEEFLRRVSLDLVGRVPSVEELKAFEQDRRLDKRAALVDSLLSSPEWSAYWAETYATLLVGQDLKEGRAGLPLTQWLEAGLASGTGWDKLADSMITATGPISVHPESGFIASNLKSGGPEILTGVVSRKFLGVQIECAQCHDHPYADFEREDFWAMAAFFARTKVRLSAKDRERKKQKKQAAKAREQMGEAPMTRAQRKSRGKMRDFEVIERPRGEIRIKAIDGEGRESAAQVRIAPAFLGEQVELGVGVSRREVLSEHMRASPLFARAAVGFVWTQMMGHGLSDRWDDLSTKAGATPKLLELLADEFRVHEYDLRWLQARIANSEAYARSSRGEEEGRAQAERVFARASVRALSSTQLFASLLQVTKLEAVGSKAFQRAVRQRRKRAVAEFSFIFSDDEMGETEVFSGNVPQALLLFNGALTNQAVLRHEGNTSDRLMGLRGDEARTRFAYRSIYARDPSRDELAMSAELVASAGGGVSAWEDLLFAMLNSTEFLTNH